MNNQTASRDDLEYAAYELKRGMYEKEPRSVTDRQEQFLRTHSGFSLVDYNATDATGLHLLHTLAGYDSAPAIETLISLGADAHTVDQQGNTLLHHAFSLLGLLNYGAYDHQVIHWAVKNGFDINIENNDGQTPLFLLGSWLAHHDTIDDDPDLGNYLEYFNEGRAEHYSKNIEDLIEVFEHLGGNIYHQDHQGHTFLDCLPYHNPQWKLLDPALNAYRPKIENKIIMDHIDDRERLVRHKKI